MVKRPQPGAPTLGPREHDPVDSFEAFFSERYEPLLRALYLLTGDRHEAEELAQEACFRVYERWERLRVTANPAGYAYRVALNAHRSRLRRLTAMARRRFRPSQPDAIGASDERDAIRRALAKIPAGQRAALVLTEWIGLTDREAGEVLGIKVEAVRMRVSRARRRLREHMKRGENDD
jgi:RNA polymerase sigma-70 factor (sigma-E family)